MSLSAVLTAVRNTLRADLTLADNECEIRPGPEPPAVAGSVYYAVYGESWNPGDRDLNRGIDEYFGIAVTVTQRLGSRFPFDKYGDEAYIKATSGLEARIRAVNSTVHQSIPIHTAANVLISGTDKMVEYFRWSGSDAIPQLRDGDWFISRNENPRSTRGAGDEYAAMVMTTRFEDARRIQTYANME